MADEVSQTKDGSAKPPIGSAKLRQLLENPESMVVCPGVYDGFTARLALKAGFECLYMTGAGTTMSRLGMPDLGVATLNDMRDNASMIASLDRSVPLIADADTGYGGPLQVGRTVSQYISAGVAALHLEDQVVNKRCGHLSNKELVPEDVYLSRIRAAVNARKQSHGDIVIIARTDALASLGFEVAISRLKKAIDIGADVAFLEGLTSRDEAVKACKELAPIPVLLNMAHGGVTPTFSVREAREMGFRIVIFPTLALNEAYKSVTGALGKLRDEGVVAYGMEKGDPSLRDLFGVCGLDEAMKFDRDAGGVMYEGGV